MKIQKFLLTLLLFSFIGNSTLAQDLFFGFTFNPAISKTSSLSGFNFNDHFIEQYAYSANIGLCLEKSIQEKSSFGVELLVVRMDGLASTESQLTERKINTTQFYLGVPIYYRKTIGRLGIKGGIQSLIFLTANEQLNVFELMNGSFQWTESQEVRGIGTNNLDFGPKIGIDFDVFENFRLRADYYHGLKNPSTNEFSFEDSMKQISLGVSFLFGINLEN